MRYAVGRESGNRVHCNAELSSIGNPAALRVLMLNILVGCKLHVMNVNELALFLPSIYIYVGEE